jgi:SAM-dependent methyltransferase
MPTLAKAFLAAAGVAGAVAVFAATGYAQPKLDVPYVPTPTAVVDRMLQLAKVQKDDFVIDLGSGDGRIAIAAARTYGAKAFGVDIDPARIREARANAKQADVENLVTFEQKNLFDTKIGEASVLTMYLLQAINLQLKPRILKEMKPGSRVVSHTFDLGDWKPDHSEVVDNRQIYMWVVPKNMQGRWPIEHNGETVHVELEQRYQTVTGKLVTSRGTTTLSEGRVIGDRIEFVADFDGTGPARFTGIAGDRIILADGALRRMAEVAPR